MSFKFLNYNYDKATSRAEFHYQGEDDHRFTERVDFAPSSSQYNPDTLDSALFLAFIIIGTSYYKAAPTASVELEASITPGQAAFFTRIYQEGLSQFAFENQLTRQDLASFAGANDATSMATHTPTDNQTLILVSGGKDSLLTTELIREQNHAFKAMYITSQESYPSIIDSFDSPLIIRRFVDTEALRNAQGLNGHVPVTLINQAIALIQAILSGFNTIELGIGLEGLEPHTFIGDLPVNHQWSKTSEAQDLLHEYISKNVTTDIKMNSILSDYNELEIAEKFASKCWNKYGHKFSSCNQANYKQSANNRELKWCGKCAKCANSFLLFAPFIEPSEQYQLFGHDLFEDPALTEVFKGLLNKDGVIKPFECVASYDELKHAYHNKLPGYKNLPFEV